MKELQIQCQARTMHNLEVVDPRPTRHTEKTKHFQSGIELSAAPPPRLNLSTSEDVRREMAKVYREVRSRQIEPNEATKLVFILTQILRAHEQVVLEARIAHLEQRRLP